MKLILLLLLVTLQSCVNNPGVKIKSPDGTVTIITTGTNLMAEVDEQVSEVQGNGWHLRHMVKRQDATRVPLGFFQMLIARLGLSTAAHSADLKTTTDGAVALKTAKDPNVIPVDPNLIPKNPNVLPFDPN